MTKKVPTIFVSGDAEKGNVYLTAGIQPPSDGGTTFEQVQVHSEMQSYASGGSIYHMNIVESMKSDKKCRFIKNLLENFPLRYISLTPILSICQECGHKTVGKEVVCNHCGSKDITCWSRPVGYYRPAVRGNLSKDLRKFDYRFWLNGRFEEFLRRKMIDNNELDELIKSKQEVIS